MKAYKDGKFLVFEMGELDEHNGEKVKFDLSTGDFISPTGRKVKTLDKYLSKYTVDAAIDSFEDEKYRKYLSFIKSMILYHDNMSGKATLNNILLGAKKYMEFEKFYLYGVEVDPIACYRYEYIPYTDEEIKKYEKSYNTKLFYTPNHSIKKFVKFEDVPKAILKFYKEYKIKINYGIAMGKYKDNVINAISQVKKIKNKEYTVLFFKALLDEYYNISVILTDDNELKDYVGSHNFYKSNTLLTAYKYNLNKLAEYINYLMEVEHVGGMDEDWKNYSVCYGPVEIMNHLNDYNLMQKKLCGNEKYDKYPKNFLTTKNIVTYKYNSMLRREKEEKLSKDIYNKDLEWEDSGFTFVSPKTPRDIINEGQNMHNCVGGYVNNVLNGHCIIMFMRLSNSPNESYITLEIDKYLHVVQSKRKYNKGLSIIERQVLDRYKQFLANAKDRRNQEKNKDKTLDVQDLALGMERA